MTEVVVCGAGGFIGGHLIADLRREGRFELRAVDVKPMDEWFQVFDDVDNRVLDLSERDACREAVAGSRYIFNLAADMGGMGFIEANKALCMLSVLINPHRLLAAREEGVERYFFASSACVYAAEKQTDAAVRPLAEADAYPAMPEDGYGWEKLFSERMARHFMEDFGIQTRVARYHNEEVRLSMALQFSVGSSATSVRYRPVPPPRASPGSAAPRSGVGQHVGQQDPHRQDEIEEAL